MLIPQHRDRALHPIVQERGGALCSIGGAVIPAKRRRSRSLSRAWASTFIGLSALACAASLAWMLTAPDNRRDVRSSMAIEGITERVLLGGIGAVASLGIGLIGIFSWPRQGRVRVRRQETSLSTYDSMTGLPTKRLYLVLLNQALARMETTRRCVAALVVELDHLRPVASSPDTPNVPLVVRVQAARIKSALRPHDALARLDERRFAVILDNLDSADRILTIVRTLQRTMALPLQVEGQEVLLSCRIGGAIAPFDGTDGDALFDRAVEMLTQSQFDDSGIAFSSDPATISSLRQVGSSPSAGVEARPQASFFADR